MYDLEEGKGIEEVRVNLIDSETGKKFTAKIDNFGDFRLKELRVGTFSLLIKKAGYYPQEIRAISAGRNVNTGDIKL